MKERKREFSESVPDNLATLGSFLIFGAAFGFLFAVLVTRPELQHFFYIKGTKTFIPRHSYWFAFSLLQLMALGGGYLICISRQWLTGTLKRGDMAAALTIGLATPTLHSLTPLMNSNIGLDWNFLVAPIVYLLLLSAAPCMCSGNVKLFPFAVIWNLLFIIAGVAFVYASARLIGRSIEWYAFIQWPILKSMVGLSFGSWLIWRQRVSLKTSQWIDVYATSTERQR